MKTSNWPTYSFTELAQVVAFLQVCRGSPTELEYVTLIPLFFFYNPRRLLKSLYKIKTWVYGKLHHQSAKDVTASRMKAKGTARNNSGKSAAG